MIEPFIALRAAIYLAVAIVALNRRKYPVGVLMLSLVFVALKPLYADLWIVGLGSIIIPLASIWVGYCIISKHE